MGGELSWGRTYSSKGKHGLLRGCMLWRARSHSRRSSCSPNAAAQPPPKHHRQPPLKQHAHPHPAHPARTRSATTTLCFQRACQRSSSPASRSCLGSHTLPWAKMTLQAGGGGEGRVQPGQAESGGGAVRATCRSTCPPLHPPVPPLPPIARVQMRECRHTAQRSLPIPTHAHFIAACRKESTPGQSRSGRAATLASGLAMPCER